MSMSTARDQMNKRILVIKLHSNYKPKTSAKCCRFSFLITVVKCKEIRRFCLGLHTLLGLYGELTPQPTLEGNTG